MEQAVQLMAGLSFGVMGASFLLRARDWQEWIRGLEGNPKRASLTLGSINILIGSFIVAFHPVWMGWKMLLTLFGALGLLKGTIYVLFPGVLAANLRCFSPRIIPALRVVGALFILFGVLLFRESCDLSECVESWDYVLRW